MCTKTILFLLAWIASSAVFAADWLCTEEASQRHGNEIFRRSIGPGWKKGNFPTAMHTRHPTDDDVGTWA